MATSETHLTIDPQIKENVVVDLPIVNKIQDIQLREKVITAWAFALQCNGYAKVSDLPGSGMPGAPELGDQSKHILYVAHTALVMKQNLERILDLEFTPSDDIMIACGLCHDVGKPFEYNPESRKRWEANPSAAGLPSARHPAYGVYVAMTVGLPEEVMHVCGCHSPEGRFVRRSMACTLVHFADDSYWFGLQSSGQLDGEVPRL